MDILIRHSLHMFTRSMAQVLIDNQGKKGNSWLTCDIYFLRRKLKEECKEYCKAENDIERMKELVDIANICLFLYIRAMLSHADTGFFKHLGNIKKEE